MKKYLIITALLFSNSVYAYEALYGIWQGAGIQDNGNQWTIRINAQKEFVVIDYPSLTCGGVLKPHKTKNMSFVFKEKLRYGIKQCLDNGEVVLIKTANNKLRYHWFGENGLLQATGDLTKVE